MLVTRIVNRDRGACFPSVPDMSACPLLLRWEPAARLDHHCSPVLSLATLAIAPSTQQAGSSPEHESLHSSRSRRLVFSGATDGSLAVWDLSGVALAAAAGQLHPLLAIPGAHQSGVNAISAACSGDGPLLLLSGGDDQALRLTEVRVTEEAGRLSAEVTAGRLFPNCHSSAVKVSTKPSWV